GLVGRGITALRELRRCRRDGRRAAEPRGPRGPLLRPAHRRHCGQREAEDEAQRAMRTGRFHRVSPRSRPHAQADWPLKSKASLPGVRQARPSMTSRRPST
ncbi:hypothetical protein RZS08_33510, partial [Arthrospira platensis SPKY1]|nr:hypothetical protein [Arthrospira platensis SPKY1]